MRAGWAETLLPLREIERLLARDPRDQRDANDDHPADHLPTAFLIAATRAESASGRTSKSDWNASTMS